MYRIHRLHVINMASMCKFCACVGGSPLLEAKFTSVKLSFCITSLRRYLSCCSSDIY